MSFQEVHYRPVLGRVLAVLTMVVCAFGAVATVVTDPAAALRYVWPLLLVGVLAWALYWRPGLEVAEHGVTVVNPLSTHFVPWPNITSIDTRYALTLHTVTADERGGTVRVWAAPASGRHRTLGLSPKDFDGIGESARGRHGEVRLTDATSTPIGNLAQLVRGRWERLRDTGAFASGIDPEASTVRWHRGTIAAVLALGAATAIGLLV
ncbi:PH domain-containing protein [Microbacterium sp. W1N]|uniref:PH domain-containing protein n=1 Tax=Microbacterium festucae TaxID=2977531 RepID=UPI0021BF24CD|nr:PH domain-containing protein [Microbacterium festucae]MCT9820475.1 PH domain-containing protein [Microbacterium festucae]